MTRNPTPPDASTAEHRALSDATRVKLLDALTTSSTPLDAHVLALAVGLHVNTVRWHLRVLAEAGLVAEETASEQRRGRPRLAYRATARATSGASGHFALLAEVLAAAHAHRGPDGVEALEEAGRVRGHSLVRPRVGGADRPTPDDALNVIVRLLDDLGFEPSPRHEPADEQITMRPCPFGNLVDRYASVVCPVHLGLMRGTLEALDAPIEATSLEPFAKPDLCIAHFRVKPALPA